MDLSGVDKPVRDQIGSAAAHSWGSWKCPCNGCTKARKNERAYIISLLEERIATCDSSDTVWELYQIIENLQNPPK